MEYDLDELTGSDFAKATARVFDKIYNGKDGVLPLSNFVDLVEKLREDFYSEELAVHMRKVEPN